MGICCNVCCSSFRISFSQGVRSDYSRSSPLRKMYISYSFESFTICRSAVAPSAAPFASPFLRVICLRKYIFLILNHLLFVSSAAAPSASPFLRVTWHVALSRHECTVGQSTKGGTVLYHGRYGYWVIRTSETWHAQGATADATK